jgi:hypothetical protein
VIPPSFEAYPAAQPAAVPAARPAARWRRVIGYMLALYGPLLSAEYISSGVQMPLLVPLTFATYFPFFVIGCYATARFGPLSFRSYFLLGALLGLQQETFVTKVAWGHPADFTAIGPALGGFSAWELFWIVLTYHPVFSAAIPFLLGCHFLGLPRPAAMGAGLKRLAIFGLPVVAGALSAFGATPTALLLATAVNLTTYTILLALFRWVGTRPNFHLSWIGWAVVIGVVVVLSVGSIPYRFTPDPLTIALSGIGVLLLAWLFRRSVRLDADRPRPDQEHVPTFRWLRYFGYLAYFCVVLGATYAALMLLGDLRYVVLLVLTSAAAVAGNLFLIVSIFRVVFTRIPRRPLRLAGPAPSEPEAVTR